MEIEGVYIVCLKEDHNAKNFERYTLKKGGHGFWEWCSSVGDSVIIDEIRECVWTFCKYTLIIDTLGHREVIEKTYKIIKEQFTNIQLPNRYLIKTPN